ncbi:MAG: hypothetical protein H8D74_00570 [Chloroflexi bacterium]|nr:hypothetical protein [Chloroflexota bacterium]
MKPNHTERTIVVRDRRQVHQFSTHNRVIDEWLPIVGKTGFVLYSLYLRMAHRDNEHCYPGYNSISEHLRISPTTISHCNKILVWCRLIAIVQGNRRVSNDYYILDVPRVTPEALDEIRRVLTIETDENSKLRRTMLKRLDEWQPIQDIWDKHKKAPVTIVKAVHSNQIDLPLSTTQAKQGTTQAKQGTTQAKQGTTQAKQGTTPSVVEQSESTIRKNNPKEQSNSNNTQNAVVAVLSVLNQFQIMEPTRTEIANLPHITADYLTAWWDWYQTDVGASKLGAGYFVQQFRDGNPSPSPRTSASRQRNNKTARERYNQWNGKQ